MKILGGTYREVTRFPSTSSLFGSGLKSACALSSMIEDLELITSCSAEELEEIRMIAASHKFKLKANSRLKPIEFHYITPLTSPSIVGLGQWVDFPSLEGEDVLAFGMLEASPRIKCNRMVYDPQKPASPKVELEKIECSELIIILNRHEARKLSGEKDPQIAAGKISRSFGAKAVIVKCGALGAFLYEKDSSTWIGAFPSSRVWPIGSGDVFSAFFAAAWLKQGQTIYDAAVFASKGVSSWTSNPEVLPTSKEQILSINALELKNKNIKVYLAGPFFNLSQNWLIETSRASLLELGAEVFSPLHEVGRGGDEVALKDLAGLDNCNSVFALLDGCDEGTIFELGYAFAKGIKVVGFSQNTESSQLKMIRGSGIPIYSDFSTAIYNSIWAGI